MRQFAVQLWRDQRGAIPALSTLFLYTILVLGMTVGIVTLRDQIVQEYGDLAVALDSLNQSWTATINGQTRGYTDVPSLTPPADEPGVEPAGLSVQVAPVPEGTPFP